MNRPVLVFGVESRIAVTIARSLHRHHIPVDVGALLAEESAVPSRVVQQFRRFPRSSANSDELLKALREAIAARGYDMLIPCTDAALAACMRHYHELSALLHVACPPPEITGRVLNDLSDDPLTTAIRRFAEHMLVLRKYYTVVSSAVLIEKVETAQPFPNSAVVIHFDDSYRDVFTHARPILTALGFPASVFVSSGYLGTARRFPHDAPFPWIFENLRPDELRELAADGFEVGSHTVNHVDLGKCTDETAAAEVMQSKRDLEAIIGGPVTLFSFPFGQETNVRPIVEDLVRQVGYRAMFSTHGGYVMSASHLFDLPRVGVSGRTRPLDLLMEIEGLSLGAILRRWRAWRTPEELDAVPADSAGRPVAVGEERHVTVD